jgi:hypothetical protein
MSHWPPSAGACAPFCACCPARHSVGLPLNSNVRPHRTPMSSVEQFLAKYSPEISAQMQAAREHLAGHFPQGFELVYDNYNALAIGFSPSERASDVVLSIAGYPKWVTLFFLKGAALQDPEKMLQGAGSQVRSVRLLPASVLTQPAVQALIQASIASVGESLTTAPPLKTVIKSVSAKQRPRQPSAAAKSSVPAKKSGRRKASEV